MTGRSQTKTLKLKGDIKDRNITILIDSRNVMILIDSDNIHNCIDIIVAKQLNLL